MANHLARRFTIKRKQRTRISTFPVTHGLTESFLSTWWIFCDIPMGRSEELCDSRLFQNCCRRFSISASHVQAWKYLSIEKQKLHISVSYYSRPVQPQKFCEAWVTSTLPQAQAYTWKWTFYYSIISSLENQMAKEPEISIQKSFQSRISTERNPDIVRWWQHWRLKNTQLPQYSGLYIISIWTLP